MREMMLTLRAEPSRVDVHRMFDRIARRYDFLNHLLSFGMDYYWRRRAVGCLPERANLKVIDLACGTGDLGLAAIRHRGESILVLGIDRAELMLGYALKKSLPANLALAMGDGLQIPVQEHSVDAVMIAFGIRNMTSTAACLAEIRRILVAGGNLIVLEFALPRNRLWRALHLFYLRTIVPGIGRLVSGDRDAYAYLNRTIESYPHGEAFCGLLRERGFIADQAISLSGGIVNLYVGTAP